MGDASGTRKRRRGGRVTRICEGYDVREIASPYCMLSHCKLQCNYFHNRPPPLGWHLSLFAFPSPVLQALEATWPRSQITVLLKEWLGLKSLAWRQRYSHARWRPFFNFLTPRANANMK